jgi:hypothetical protein
MNEYTLTLIGGPANLDQRVLPTKPPLLYKVSFLEGIRRAHVTGQGADPVPSQVARYRVSPAQSPQLHNHYIGLFEGVDA